MPEPRTFTIGITMAGAVSAGAYTAGVLDYLFRALDHHAARLAAGGPGAPQHRVVLKVMSGASAGGVCSGLAIAALAESGRTRLRRLRLSGARLSADARARLSSLLTVEWQ